MPSNVRVTREGNGWLAEACFAHGAPATILLELDGQYGWLPLADAEDFARAILATVDELKAQPSTDKEDPNGAV